VELEDTVTLEVIIYIKYIIGSNPVISRIVKGCLNTIKLLYSQDFTIYIVSDANTYFIETVLKHYNIRDYFSQVITNPASFDDIGALKIRPYHSTPHCCTTVTAKCPPNMCKGKIIQELFREPYDMALYFGDGSGDYCAVSKLSSNDRAFVRVGRSLFNLVDKGRDSGELKSHTHYWNDASELFRVVESTLM